MKAQKHPTRDQLLKGTSPKVRAHVKSCPACRELQELLRVCYPDGRIGLENPPDDLMNRLAVIPVLEDSRRKRRLVRGTVAVDSWSGLATAQIRDAAVGSDRRLTLQAGPVTLELVAERTLEGWKFTARAYRDSQPTNSF